MKKRFDKAYLAEHLSLAFFYFSYS